MLADGLGGLQNGRDASELAVGQIEASWQPRKDEGLEAWLTNQFQKANQLLAEYAAKKNAKVRTTLVVLRIHGLRAAWAHTGDSRLYYIHKGRIAHITADHSVAYKKYKAGEISRSEISKDEDQSSLLRTLGGAERWEPDTASSDIEAGDAFFLCSDGFWEYVRDHEILFEYLKSGSAREWTERLLVKLLSRVRENNDNLSAIAVFVE